MIQGNDSMETTQKTDSMETARETDSMDIIDNTGKAAMAKKTESTVVFGADHGGFELKGVLIEQAKEMGYRALDAGIFTPDAADYPDNAEKAARIMLAGRADKAVLICGTGVGISISANKIPGVRCALCSDVTSARLSREHNDANALALGGRIVGAELAKDILRAFLCTGFLGGRHELRVNKIMALENFDMDKPAGEYRE